MEQHRNGSGISFTEACSAERGAGRLHEACMKAQGAAGAWLHVRLYRSTALVRCSSQSLLRASASTVDP